MHVTEIIKTTVIITIAVFVFIYLYSWLKMCLWGSRSRLEKVSATSFNDS